MTRILVIDDQVQVREFAIFILKESGFEVDEAANGQIAIERFKQHPADLVITDIFMPEVDGLETIRELRRLNSAVKIIAMSGGSIMQAENRLQVAQELGAQWILSKPFSIADLTNAVRAVLKA